MKQSHRGLFPGSIAAITGVVLLVLIVPSAVHALPKAFTELIDAFVLAEADRNSNRNQSESTSMADNSTTIVEHTSVPDFLGLAINPALLQAESEADDERNNSYSGSISGETFFAALRGAVPGQEDYFYDGGGLEGFLRGTTFLAGYDDPTDGDQRPARRFGMKVRLLGDARVADDRFNGLSFLKTAPARVLARPARAVFRPGDLRFESWRSVEDDELANLKAAAEKANESSNDRERWASRVCRNDITWQTSYQENEEGRRVMVTGYGGNAIRIPQFFPSRLSLAEQDAQPDRLSRVASAYTYAGNYLYDLVCERKKAPPAGDAVDTDRPKSCGNGGSCVTPLVKRDKVAEFYAFLGKHGWRAKQLASGASVEADLQELFDGSIGRTPESTDAPIVVAVASDEAARKRKAYTIVKALSNSGLLTDLGVAVRHWVVGNYADALAGFRVHVDALSKKPGIGENFKTATGKLESEINKRTELSFEFQSKLRRGLEDEHTAMLIFEASPLKDCAVWGIGRSSACDWLRYLNITANAGFDVVDDHETSEQYGGSAAVSLALPLGAAFFGSPAIGPQHTVSLSGKARWLKDGNDQYIGQAKISFQLAAGVELPLTFTVADRTALQADTDLRGQIGLVFDTSRLLDFARTSLTGTTN